MKKKTTALPVLAFIAAVLAILAIVVFTLENQRNISKNNREYLVDNTSQMVVIVDDSLRHGLTNIQALSKLAGEIMTSPEVSVSVIQRVLSDSIFDFIEFADKDGKNHNTTGSVSEAGDRQYYLDAMKGNTGTELIFNSRATNQTLLLFYSPVRYQGEIVGSLIGAYEDTHQLSKLLTMDVFGFHAETYLCSADGMIIASNQGIDTTAEIAIMEVLGPRIANNEDRFAFFHPDETRVIPLNGNETGACITRLTSRDWYIAQVFPAEANEMMVASANRLGILLAGALVAVLMVLLASTYLILNRSRLETEEALVRAEAASRAKTDFLFSISHDIRTPMNAVIGFLRLLKEQQDKPEKRKEYIKKMEDSSELLLSIINNVLEMSELEGGKAALNETAWSMEQLLETICALPVSQMEEKGILFEKSISVQHPFIWCDMTKLQEVCLNILNNAGKYTPSGGKVSLRMTELPSEREGFALYQIVIEDNGIGIGKEFMPRLFEPFARENDTTHSKIAGTGLGMTIAKRLVELMDGSVKVESEPKKGTRCTVTIYHRVASEEDVRAREAEAPADFSGKRILLAEDNDLNAEIAAELLGEMGCEVERAQDGDVCVSLMERAGSRYYNLILMDVQMPRMDGYRATEAIRKMDDPAKANIPIITMSANALEDDKRNACAAGMNAHLAKPIDVQKLKEVLAEFL